MTRLLHALYIAILAGLCAPAQGVAETLFLEDFQDGKADGWTAGGDGDIRLTTYQGNVSMQMTRKAAAQIVLAIQGYQDVTVAASFAAAELEGKDACIAEISADGGKTWTDILRVADGQDDSLTLHSGSASPGTVSGDQPLVIRARVAGNGDNDTCWLDNVRVSGRKRTAANNSGSDTLSAAFLTGSAPLPGPVDYGAFRRPADASDPSNSFEGRLRFTPSADTSGFDVVQDALRFEAAPDQSFHTLPAFDFEFVQFGDRLIPTRRGVVVSDAKFWEWVVEAGYVWDAPADGGLTRAAIPFAIQEKNANCTHNGVLTFLFSSSGDISRAAFQIASETCLYFKFNAWGTAEASYVPGKVAGSDKLRAAFEREIANRLPTKPIGAVANDHPGIDPSRFGAASDVDPEHMTAYGVVIDGVHYVGGCGTRYGPYPYCDELDLPSYSTAKTIFAGVAFMALERLYPGTKDALIADYVPECAEAGDWDGVTFDHAMDMATGQYNSAEREADENTSTTHPFFLVPTHAEKIRIACTRFPKKEEPGKTWVYHTSDHYILGTAMNTLWREKTDVGNDIYSDLMADRVWQELGVSPTLGETRRTYDEVAQPFAGWGLTYLRDDIAKVAAFLAGTTDAKDLLDTDELAAALQRNPEDRGLPAASDEFRYNNGFWAWNIQEFMGCNKPTWIPFMSGFGGVSVILAPNGAVYYYVSDNGDFRWAQAVAELDKLQPFCSR